MKINNQTSSTETATISSEPITDPQVHDSAVTLDDILSQIPEHEQLKQLEASDTTPVAKQPTENTIPEDTSSKSTDSTEPEDEEEVEANDTAEMPDEKEDETNPKEDQEKEGKDATQKRIDQLTARSKSAEEKLSQRDAMISELQEKLNQASAIRLEPTPENPLANINSMQELNKLVEEKQNLKEWAYENMEGTTVKTKDGTEKFIEASEVRKHLALADKILSVHVPQRAQYLHAVSQLKAEAQQVYPNLFDTSSEDYQMAVAFKQKFPDVVKLPNHDLLIGDALEGQRARMARTQNAALTAKAKAKPSASTPPPPPVPKANTGIPKPAREANKSQAMERFKETGSQHDLEDALMSIV